MTAVRSRACIESGKVIGLFNLRPPTDVMAITSLPHAPANHPVPLCALLQCGLLPLPACQRVNLPAMGLFLANWPTVQL